MLSYLVTFAFSETEITHTKYLYAYWKDTTYSAFDIKYNERADTGGTSWVMTTYSFGGWKPVFTVDNDPTLIKMPGTRHGKANYRNIYSDIKVEKVPLGDKYLLVSFLLTNKDTVPHTINVSSYADIMIKNNDHAKCTWYGNRRGLTMYDKYTNITLTLLAKGGYKVSDYDQFWYGMYGIGYHYFYQLESDEPLVNTDSVFSISWTRRDIYPNETLVFSTLMGVGADLRNPSLINIETNFQENYDPNTEITVNGVVNDVDANETVDVYYEFNNGPRQFLKRFETDKVNGGISNGQFSFKVQLGSEVARYPLKVYAIDSFELTSNVFEKNLLVNQAPRVSFTTRPNDEYFTGGIVVVEGRIWDDTKATLKYKVDDGYNWNTDVTLIECNRQEKTFRKSFPIQESYINFGDHVIYIWAEDEFGVKSTIISSPFKYTQLHTPEIQFTTPQTSIENKYRGDTITISGKVRDVDANQVVTIYYKKPENDPTTPAENYYSFNTNDANRDWVDFELEYVIPDHLPFGEHSLIIFAIDSRNANSADLHYRFNVIRHTTTNPTPIDPTPTPGDEYEDIVDSSYSGPSADSEIPTITCTSVADINDDLYESCTITTTTIIIKTSEIPTPKPTPDQTAGPAPVPSASEEAPWGGDGDAAKEGSSQKSKTDKKKMLIIGCAAGGVAAVACAAAAVLIHEAIKKPKDFVFDEENGEFVEADGNGAANKGDNPIYDENGADDPFADEFDEEDGHVEGIFPA